MAFEPYILPPLDEEGQVPVEMGVPFEEPIPIDVRPQPNPEVQAQMEAEFGPPPGVGLPPEALAAQSVDATSGAAPVATEEPQQGQFGSFLEQEFAPQQPAPAQPFDLQKEGQALQGGPVPENVSGPELQQKEEERLLGLTPEQFAQEQAKRQLDYEQRQVQRSGELAEESAARDMDAASTYRGAVAKTQQELAVSRERIAELSQRKPEGFFSHPPNAEGALGIIKAIAIGLVSPLHGLVALEGVMHDDMRRQEHDIQRQMFGEKVKANILGEELALHGDLLKAQQTVNLAWKQALPQMLAAEMSKYDRNGSTALKLATAVRQAQAQGMAAQAAYEKGVLETNIKIGDFNARQQKAIDDHAKFKRDMAPKSPGPRYTAADIQKLYPGLNVPDKPGGWTPKEVQQLVGVRKDVAELTGEKKDATAELKEYELDEKKRASQVVDSTGADLGRARGGVEGAKEARTMGFSYEKFRTTMGRLVDAVQKNKSAYKGIGSDRWPSEARTEIETMRIDLANQLAKLRDPASVNRDSEITAAMKEIPDLDSWSTSKNPLTKYKTLVKTADDVYETYLGVSIENFDPEKSPTKRYQAKDRQLLAPAPSDAPPRSPEQVQATKDAVAAHERELAAQVQHAESANLPFTEKLSEDGKLIIRTYSNGSQVVRGVPEAK